MMRLLIFNLSLIFFSCTAQQNQPTSQTSDGGTLRIDLILRGDTNNTQCKIADIKKYKTGGTGLYTGHNTTMGQYRFTLYSHENGSIIYQDGFSTLYEEWITTDFPGKEPIDFEQLIETPMPQQTIRFVLEKRNSKGDMIAVLDSVITPASIKTHIPNASIRVKKLAINGNPQKKVDVLVLAEGYTDKEQDEFFNDANRFKHYFFSCAPFNLYEKDFNISAAFLPSKQTGCGNPSKNYKPLTVLGSTFNTFGSERYLQTLNLFKMGDYASCAPHDLIVVLVNSPIYGGGGVFNSFAIGSADNSKSMRVMMHEIGHAFAGLADEYYDSEVPYTRFYTAGIEPWEPNITNLSNFASKWEKEMNGTDINLVEGAGYEAKGMFRSSEQCMMKSLEAPFCKVCQIAIVKRIQLVCGKQNS